MYDNSICFILSPDGYVEITLAELKRRRETDPTYISKRFIALHGMLMEVSDTDYHDFYKARRRQKYLEEEAARASSFSYHAYDSDEMSGEDIISDEALPIDEQVSDKLDIENMLRCFSKLNETERKLLSAIYFDGKSERQLSKDTGVPQKTVNNRKRRAIARLKKLLEI
jgi:RNA polymerase sigma factor (sigma-70 family)